MIKKFRAIPIILLVISITAFDMLHCDCFNNRDFRYSSKTSPCIGENRAKNGIRVIIFVTPDSSYKVLEMLFRMASSSISIIAYQMWSEDLLNLIDESARRGVTVRVLLEGDPFGDIGDKWNLNMSAMLFRLKSAGLPVEIKLENVQSRYLHAKAMIIDGSIVLITSENFLPTAFPPDPRNIPQQPYRKASRGWGVVIFDRNFAMECDKVFSRVYVNESIHYDPCMGTGEKPPISGYITFSPRFDFKEVYVQGVEFIWSPFNSLSRIKSILCLAKHFVFIEQMYILERDEGVSELVSILSQKAAEGTTVQMVIEDDPPGNYDDIIRNFTQRGFYVAPAFYYEPKLFLHNKGLLVDDNYALIGSINWSGTSLLRNIEFAALINSTEATLYLKKVFEWDWNKSSSKSFDSDLDGLPDNYELDHGLNPNECDTDSDGLTDYDEIFKYGTDPRVSDAVSLLIEGYTNGSVVASKRIVLKWTIKNRQHVSKISIRVNGTEVSRVDPVKENASIELRDQAWSTIEIIPEVRIPVKTFPSAITIYVDSQSPILEILYPQNNTGIKGDRILLKLIIKDNTSVALTICLNGTQIYNESVPVNVIKSLEIPLRYGLNVIAVIARDAAGNEAIKLLYIQATPSIEMNLYSMLGLLIIFILLVASMIISWKRKSLSKIYVVNSLR